VRFCFCLLSLTSPLSLFFFFLIERIIFDWLMASQAAQTGSGGGRGSPSAPAESKPAGRKDAGKPINPLDNSGEKVTLCFWERRANQTQPKHKRSHKTNVSASSSTSMLNARTITAPRLSRLPCDQQRSTELLTDFAGEVR
jgi:hypothetical protein